MAGAAERTLSSSRIRQARRRQLVEAAIACIAEHGLAETTLSAVTTRAGLSHGLANFHFESKDALLSETLGHLAEEHHAEWRRALDSAGPAAADRLGAVIAADFAPAVCTPERLAVWFAFWGQARTGRSISKSISVTTRPGARCYASCAPKSRRKRGAAMRSSIRRASPAASRR